LATAAFSPSSGDQRAVERRSSPKMGARSNAPELGRDVAGGVVGFEVRDRQRLLRSGNGRLGDDPCHPQSFAGVGAFGEKDQWQQSNTLLQVIIVIWRRAQLGIGRRANRCFCAPQIFLS
jgi:hypothetical protein